MTARLLLRWTAPLLALAFIAAVCAALLRTVPDDVDVPLSPIAAIVEQRLVPIPALFSQQGHVTRQIVFTVGDAPQLAAADELRLVVDGHGQSSRLVASQLDLNGTTCVFTAPPRTLDFSSVLSLSRASPCSAAPGSGHATLTLQFKAAGASSARASIWLAPVRPGAAPLLSVDGPAGGTPVGHAVHRRSMARVRTSALLAWMWNCTERAFWRHVAAGAVLLLAGAVLGGWGVRWPLAAAASAFCLAAGLALVYAIAVPPLQAPDESDHLLSFGKLTEREGWKEREADWARRIHFDRITFRAGERFTPADRDAPYYRAWSESDVFAEDVAHRTLSATRWWQLLSRAAPDFPPAALLRIRSADAILFGLAFAVGTAAAASTGAIAAPLIVALVLLAIPTLPFFGVQMSEITPNVVAYVLIGYAGAAMLADSRSELAGLLLGVAAAVIAAGTRSGWPVEATVTGLLGARVVTARAANRRTIVFWVAFALPVLLLFGTRVLHVPQPWYNQWHLPGLDPREPVRTRTVFAAVTVVTLLGFGLELGWGAIRRRTAIRMRLFQWLAAAAGLWIAGTLVASAFMHLPILPAIEGDLQAMSVGSYVRHVLLSVVTTARVSGPDFFVWTSFLGGFGWLDTFLPQRLLIVVTVFGALAAMRLLFSVARDQDDARAVVAACVALGVMAAVVGCAIGSYGLDRNLHGRYLLGPYLVGIAVLCAAPPRLTSSRLSLLQTSVLLPLVAVTHAVAIWVLMERYFG